MEFMSAEHVAAMNDLLRNADAVRSACAELGAPRVLSYVLSEGSDGEPVHWTISFDETVQCSLNEATTSDVRLSGDWTRMILAATANRDGTAVDPSVRIEGDTQILAEIGPILELARAVATVPVEFPST